MILKTKSITNLLFVVNFFYEEDFVCLSWKYLPFADGGIYVQENGQGRRPGERFFD